MIKALSFQKQASEVATPEELAALEAKLGVRLPPALVEFCSRWNGGLLCIESEFYPVPCAFNEFYEEYGVQAKGVLVHILYGATQKHPQCDLLKDYNLINKYSNLGIIPIAENLFGDRAVLRSDSPTGFVYWWDHELWELPDNPNPVGNVAERPRLIPIAQDLEYFYNSLTSDPDE